MSAALIQPTPEITDEVRVRHRAAAVDWSVRRPVQGTVGRHRRERRSVLVIAGGPVLVAGAVAVSATAGTLSLSAAGARGAEDLGIRTDPGTTSLLAATADRAGLERASRGGNDGHRGLLSVLLGRTATAPKAAPKAAAVTKAAKEVAAKEVAAKKAAPAFVKPLTRYRITARFGAAGSHWRHHHMGLDFAAPTGTPVRAVADGVVVSSGWAGAYGYRTIVRHADGTRTWYCHQSRLIVRHGKVKAGQIIGRVGSTGNTTGPHLHLEVRRHGVPTDPAVWLRQHGLHA